MSVRLAVVSEFTDLCKHKRDWQESLLLFCILRSLWVHYGPDTPLKRHLSVYVDMFKEIQTFSETKSSVKEESKTDNIPVTQAPHDSMTQ